MNNVSMILMAVMMAALLVMIAPGIFAMNRGKVLQNIALWLAIFTGLALVYQTFGPGSQHPLFGLPATMVREPPMQKGADKADDNPPTGDHGYTPPRE